MNRLPLNRFLLGGAFVLIWLVPGLLDFFLSPFLIAPDSRLWIEAHAPPSLLVEAVNGGAMVLAPALFVLFRPTPPTGARSGDMKPFQREQAGLVDFAVIVTVFTLPAQAGLAALNAWHVGQGLDGAWLVSPRPLYGGAFMPIAWFGYTALHLALRRPTTGQQVAGYRLVFPTPVPTMHEPVVQTVHILGGELLDLLRSKFAWAQPDAEWRDDPEPSWRRSAGIRTEQLEYR